MSNLSEIVGKVNAATAAIAALQPNRRSGAGKEIKLKMLRSLYGSIREARSRGISFTALLKTLKETTGMKIGTNTFKAYLKIIEEEEEKAVKDMSRSLAERHSK